MSWSIDGDGDERLALDLGDEWRRIGVGPLGRLDGHRVNLHPQFFLDRPAGLSHRAEIGVADDEYVGMRPGDPMLVDGTRTIEEMAREVAERFDLLL